jgi:hypothetical protein
VERRKLMLLAKCDKCHETHILLENGWCRKCEDSYEEDFFTAVEDAMADSCECEADRSEKFFTAVAEAFERFPFEDAQNEKFAVAEWTLAFRAKAQFEGVFGGVDFPEFGEVAKPLETKVLYTSVQDPEKF